MVSGFGESPGLFQVIIVPSQQENISGTDETFGTAQTSNGYLPNNSVQRCPNGKLFGLQASCESLLAVVQNVKSFHKKRSITNISTREKMGKWKKFPSEIYAQI
jgi:hypothetical protein